MAKPRKIDKRDLQEFINRQRKDNIEFRSKACCSEAVEAILHDLEDEFLKFIRLKS